MKRKKLRERICALVLALIMPLTGIMPQAMVTVQAADPIDVTINIIGDSYDTFTVYSSGGIEVTANSDGTYPLEEGETYSYNFTKSGYEDATGKIMGFSAADATASINLTMSMSDIGLGLAAGSSDSINVGGSTKLEVQNPISDAAYNWSSSDTSVATVAPDGTVTGVGTNGADSATATITASYGGKSANYNITVSKIETAITLSISPATGDDTDVILTATGLKEDATGTITFEINGSSFSVKLPATTYTISKAMGNIEAKATYSGDIKYKGSVSSSESRGPYNRNQKIAFTEGTEQAKPKVATLNSEGKYEFSFNKVIDSNNSIINDINSLNYKVEKWSSDDSKFVASDKLTVDTNSRIATATESGFYKITVTAAKAADQFYNETTAEFYIYVQDRIDFSNLNLTVAPVSRVYNGGTQVALTATLSESDLKNLNIFTGDADTTSGATFELTGDVSSADVDSYTEVSEIEISGVKIGDTALNVAVDVESTDTLSGLNISITKRKVYIGTVDVKVTNTNQNTTRALVEAQTGKATDESTGEDEGFLENEKESLLAGIGVTVANNFYYEGNNGTAENKNQVTPILNNLTSDYDNYDVQTTTDSSKLGNIEVTNMSLTIDEILKKVTLSAENGNLFISDGTIWVGTGEDVILKAAVTENDYFDTVCFVTSDNNTTGGTEGSYTATYTESSKSNSVYVYLKNDGVVCSQLTNLAQLIYNVDGDVPVVEFDETVHSKASVLDKVLGTITFGLYKKETAQLPVTVVDMPIGYGSDVASWSYAIYRPEKNADGKYEEVTGQTIKDLYENDKLSFTDIGKDKSSFDIPVDYQEGYAVVLIYAEDNVGNAEIYASNGIAMEVEKPTIKITDSDGNSIISNIPYSSSVDYKVTVNDYTDDESDNLDKIVISGIKEYTVTVYDGNSTIAQATETVAEADSYYSLAQLKGLVDEYEGTISTESNNLRIEVKATDQAGNTATVSQSLMIDTTNPTIETSVSSEASVQNGKYYNKEVVMEVKYKEKNFDTAGMAFDVYLENATYKDLTLGQLSALDGISCSAIEDSESREVVSTYTNERVNTLKITVSKEEEYKIIPHYTDLGGLENIESDADVQQIFVIDETAPVIEVSYSPITPGSTENSRVYTQKDVTASVKITEKNFYEDEKFKNSQMDFSATSGRDYEGTEVVSADTYKAVATGEWSQNGIEYTNASFTFTEDANYVFGFTYTDLAGNTAVYSSAYFTVDDTAPTGTVSIDKNTWNKFLSVITFGIFKNTPYSVEMTSEDVTAGVETTQYYKTSSKKTLNELQAYTGWKNYSAFSVSPNEQFIVYGKIVDKSGNVTYLSTDGAIADNTKPQITITNLSTARNGIYAGDVSLKIDVTDPTKGDTYSGLERVWYDVTATGNVTENETKTLVDNSDNRVQGNQNFSDTIVIDSEKFNSNDVKVVVHALDFSGNKYDSDTVELKIDTTAPVIEDITWNTNDASNGKYYNVTRVATITVRERNFDPNQVRLNITNTDGTSAEVSGWNVDTSGTSDNNTNTCTVTFSADGDYTMNVSCTDLAGNDSNTVSVEEFTIDKTVPVINVSFDNNRVANGKYYNAARTATITVDEHNFNGADVQTAITSNTSTPGVNGWSTGGDVHTATVPFTTDGNYSFTVNYTDLAGNAAEVYSVDEFVIDLTKPEIEIFDIEDKSANNGEVAPGVRYSDTNYDVKGVSITYSGAEHAEKAVDGARTSITNGESIKMADFEHTAETDDIYTMVAKVTDLAGNSDEKQVTFSVNRFGSNFRFSKETDQFLDDYYNNEEETLVVEEINVDTLTHRGIASSHDGDITELKEGTDYTVKESGSEVSWKSYVYTIKKSNFEEEGLYNITIDSVDRATNQVNNKIKEANIEFIIDKTAPTVVITGIENDKQYRSDTRDITVAVSDNVAMESAEVYVNDTKAESYNANTIQRQKGELPYKIESSSDWQNIKAVAVDKAGNVTDTSKPEDGGKEEWISVLVTSNLFVQFYRNTPLVVGTVIVLICLAGFFFLILAKRRKKEEEEEAVK